MADSRADRRAPFLTAEQQDLAAYAARLVGEEIEARLGPTLDAIVTGLAAVVETIEQESGREPTA